jgi:hypothetical protein
MSLLEIDGNSINDAIKPLQLNMPSPETYNLIDRLGNEMEQSTGINEVIKGTPGPNLRSGNALTFIAAQAVKFNSTLQQYINDLFESVGTGTLSILQKYAKAPRFIAVVGQSNKSFLKEFSSEDIELVSRVMVQRASALTNTTAGKIELADNLLKAGLIKNPKEYLMVLETGRLDHAIEADQMELMNQRSENELMMKGQLPIVLISDNHPQHIQAHLTILDDPSTRENPELVQMILDHVQQHINIWPQVPPEILAAKNIAQSPSAMMQAPMPQPEQPQGNPEVTPAQNGNVLAPMDENAGTPPLPELPGLPPNASPEDQQAFRGLDIGPV